MALAVLCIIGFIAYWVPTLAANSNRHRNRAAIGMLNLFLGWTVIGWVVALIWADTDNCELDRVWDNGEDVFNSSRKDTAHGVHGVVWTDRQPSGEGIPCFSSSDQ
jgi:hypothetical protein